MRSSGRSTSARHNAELICDVEAGLSGERFERELARRSYSFGLATCAAGQLSTKYGKVEDRCAGLTVVTGRSEVIKTDGPSRALRGPSWRQLLLDSKRYSA